MNDNNNKLEIFQQIIDKADIVDVLSRFVNVTKKGNNYMCLCPFHNDSTPSLSISPKKKIWKCFVCGAKGNVISFVQQFKKISYLDAAYMVANLIGFDLNKFSSLSNTAFDPKIKYLYDINKQANLFFEGFINDDQYVQLKQYIQKRKLSPEAIKYFQIGYAPKTNIISKVLTNKDNMFGNDYDKNLIWNDNQLYNASLINLSNDGKAYDYFSNRLMFPIINKNGYIVGFSGRTIDNDEVKYLNSKETPIFNKKDCLFNIYNALNNLQDKLIVVEGYMDTVGYFNAGYKNVVATMGVNLSDYQIKTLLSIENLKTIILSYDNDNAGIAATIAIGKHLLEYNFNVFVVKYPTATAIKDVDELYNQQGKTGVDAIINNKVDFITFLIQSSLKNKNSSLDEKIIIINELLQFIVQFGDRLLKTAHLETISTYSNIPLVDLVDKYEQIYINLFSNSNIQTISTKKIIDLNKAEMAQQTPNKPTTSEIIITHFSDENANKLNNDKLIINNAVSDIFNICLCENKLFARITEDIDFNKFKDIIPNYMFSLFKIGVVMNTSNIYVTKDTLYLFMENHYRESANFSHMSQYLNSPAFSHLKKFQQREAYITYEKLINHLNINYYQYLIDINTTKRNLAMKNNDNNVLAQLSNEFSIIKKRFDELKRKKN